MRLGPTYFWVFLDVRQIEKSTHLLTMLVLSGEPTIINVHVVNVMSFVINMHVYFFNRISSSLLISSSIFIIFLNNSNYFPTAYMNSNPFMRRINNAHLA